MLRPRNYEYGSFLGVAEDEIAYKVGRQAMYVSINVPVFKTKSSERGGC